MTKLETAIAILEVGINDAKTVAYKGKVHQGAFLMTIVKAMKANGINTVKDGPKDGKFRVVIDGTQHTLDGFTVKGWLVYKAAEAPTASSDEALGRLLDGLKARQAA